MMRFTDSRMNACRSVGATGLMNDSELFAFVVTRLLPLDPPKLEVGAARCDCGHLQAAGRIAWRFDNRAGVRLDASVHVSDWMARQGSALQQRVDFVLRKNLLIHRGAVPCLIE